MEGSKKQGTWQEEGNLAGAAGSDRDDADRNGDGAATAAAQKVDEDGGSWTISAPSSGRAWRSSTSGLAFSDAGYKGVAIASLGAPSRAPTSDPTRSPGSDLTDLLTTPAAATTKQSIADPSSRASSRKQEGRRSVLGSSTKRRTSVLEQLSFQTASPHFFSPDDDLSTVPPPSAAKTSQTASNVRRHLSSSHHPKQPQTTKASRASTVPRSSSRRIRQRSPRTLSSLELLFAGAAGPNDAGSSASSPPRATSSSLSQRKCDGVAASNERSATSRKGASEASPVRQNSALGVDTAVQNSASKVNPALQRTAPKANPTIQKTNDSKVRPPLQSKMCQILPTRAFQANHPELQKTASEVNPAMQETTEVIPSRQRTAIKPSLAVRASSSRVNPATRETATEMIPVLQEVRKAIPALQRTPSKANQKLQDRTAASIPETNWKHASKQDSGTIDSSVVRSFEPSSSLLPIASSECGRTKEMLKSAVLPRLSRRRRKGSYRPAMPSALPKDVTKTSTTVRQPSSLKAPPPLPSSPLHRLALKSPTFKSFSAERASPEPPAPYRSTLEFRTTSEKSKAAPQSPSATQRTAFHPGPKEQGGRRKEGRTDGAAKTRELHLARPSDFHFPERHALLRPIAPEQAKHPLSVSEQANHVPGASGLARPLRRASERPFIFSQAAGAPTHEDTSTIDSLPTKDCTRKALKLQSQQRMFRDFDDPVGVSDRTPSHRKRNKSNRSALKIRYPTSPQGTSAETRARESDDKGTSKSRSDDDEGPKKQRKRGFPREVMESSNHARLYGRRSEGSPAKRRKGRPKASDHAASNATEGGGLSLKGSTSDSDSPEYHGRSSSTLRAVFEQLRADLPPSDRRKRGRPRKTPEPVLAAETGSVPFGRELNESRGEFQRPDPARRKKDMPRRSSESQLVFGAGNGSFSDSGARTGSQDQLSPANMHQRAQSERNRLRRDLNSSSKDTGPISDARTIKKSRSDLPPGHMPQPSQLRRGLPRSILESVTEEETGSILDAQPGSKSRCELCPGDSAVPALLNRGEAMPPRGLKTAVGIGDLSRERQLETVRRNPSAMAQKSDVKPPSASRRARELHHANDAVRTAKSRVTLTAPSRLPAASPPRLPAASPPRSPETPPKVASPASQALLSPKSHPTPSPTPPLSRVVVVSTAAVTGATAGGGTSSSSSRADKRQAEILAYAPCGACRGCLLSIDCGACLPCKQAIDYVGLQLLRPACARRACTAPVLRPVARGGGGEHGETSSLEGDADSYLEGDLSDDASSVL